MMEILDIYRKAISIGAMQLANLTMANAKRNNIHLDFLFDISPSFLNLEQLFLEIKYLSGELLEIYPDAFELENRWTPECKVNNNCYSCSMISHEGGIWCAVHPHGYPETGCSNFEYDPAGLKRLESKLRTNNMVNNFRANELKQQLELYKHRLASYNRYQQGLLTEKKNLSNKPGYEDYLSNLESAIKDSLESIEETESKIQALEQEINQLAH